MTVVVADASAVVAALLDAGPVGAWASRVLAASDVAAPHLMPCEASNLVRRTELRGAVSAPEAAQAHADLVDLAAELFPFEPFAARVWQLRPNVTAYDAWYIAVAEALDAPLATVDRRLARAAGVRCDFLLP